MALHDMDNSRRKLPFIDDSIPETDYFGEDANALLLVS